MKKYQIIRTVEKAEGWQLYECEAESKEEAYQKFLKGEDKFITEEVEEIQK